MPKLLEKQDTYITHYPQAIEYAKKQSEIFWLPDEIHTEKDVQDILVEMTDAERHGVITVLKLFTLYELQAGNEYWGKRIKETFQRPDIQRMATTFSYFELAVHAPFYNKINEVLHLNTEEFYTSYTNDPVLKERMEFIEKAIDHPDILYSLGVFSMVEGAILYSSFAFLKHFQSQGKNKLNNIVAGINFSVRDENLHSEAGSWLFNTLLKETLEEEKYYNWEELRYSLETAAEKLREHEHRIVDMIFEKGKIDGITDVQMKHFVDSRINLCLKNLGIPKLVEVNYNPVADWFYRGINSVVMHDFFVKTGNSYNRNWTESAFTWKTS